MPKIKRNLCEEARKRSVRKREGAEFRMLFKEKQMNRALQMYSIHLFLFYIFSKYILSY